MLLNLTPSDLDPFVAVDLDKAQAMIDDALAIAVSYAPCLAGDMPDASVAAARAILRRAILRWNDAGSGAFTQHAQTAGPFTDSVSVDNRTSNVAMFYNSEIDQLRELCGAGATARMGWMA